MCFKKTPSSGFQQQEQMYSKSTHNVLKLEKSVITPKFAWDGHLEMDGIEHI